MSAVCQIARAPSAAWCGSAKSAAPRRTASRSARDELEPAHHRVGDPVAEAQAEEVGGREVGGELGVARAVEGEREVDPAAREGEAREARIDARVLDRPGQGAVGPAVEGDVRQGGGDHRLAGRGQVIVLARMLGGRVLVGHGVGFPFGFFETGGGQRGLLPLYSALLPIFETHDTGKVVKTKCR